MEIAGIDFEEVGQHDVDGVERVDVEAKATIRCSVSRESYEAKTDECHDVLLHGMRMLMEGELDRLRKVEYKSDMKLPSGGPAFWSDDDAR